MRVSIFQAGRAWLGLALVMGLGAGACTAPDVSQLVYYDGTSYAPTDGATDPQCVTDPSSMGVVWPPSGGQIGRLSEPSLPESTMRWTSEVLADGAGSVVFLTTASGEPDDTAPATLVVAQDECFYLFVAT